MVVFPKIFSEHKELLQQGSIVLITGKPDHREDKLSILVDKIQNDMSVATAEGVVTVTIPKKITNKQLLKLKKIFDENPGNKKATLVFEDSSKDELVLNQGINWNENLAKSINTVLSNIELEY